MVGESHREMASEKRARVEHLIVDANAFIRNVNLSEIAENIYTIQNVIDEIRDKDTRQRLQVLPYEITFRVPKTESIQAVTEFSKKTGDYPSLSATDLAVLGLTHFLESEVIGGTDHLNSEPKNNQTLINPQRKQGDVTLVGGIAVPTVHGFEQDSGEGEDEIEEETNVQNEVDADESILKRIENVQIEQGDEDVEDEENCSDDDEEDGDDGWITVDNIKSIKKTMGIGEWSAEEQNMPRVACMTADFAMQNVLIQMGLKCLSLDGLCIRRARTYILRCFACYQRTTEMERIFCKSCGNKGTLKKVAVEIDDVTGELKMFINFKKPINQRGLRYSIPRIKGGKHANNPILNEYQPRPQNRMPKKALQKLNAMDPDFCAQGNPFSKNDVQSRAAMLNVRHIRGLTPGLDRDPYMNRVKTGNKKKKNKI